MPRLAIAASVLLLVGLGFVAVFRSSLPYSIGDIRARQAIVFHSALKRWQKGGGELKDYIGGGNQLKVEFVRTNFSWSGKAYTGDVIWRHYSLDHKGLLVGTTNAQVFWFGTDGTISLLKGNATPEGSRSDSGSAPMR